ncbi:hypothetical protein FQZ97_733370 [compost metagenome]
MLCCTSASEAARSLASVGRLGRYMSMDSGAKATRAASRIISVRPASTGVAIWFINNSTNLEWWDADQRQASSFSPALRWRYTPGDIPALRAKKRLK